MYMNVDKSDFFRAFDAMGRGSSFTPPALEALFEYYEELEENMGSPIELDVVAICCEWSEEELEDVLKSYDCEDIDELRDNTTCIELCNGNILYMPY